MSVFGVGRGCGDPVVASLLVNCPLWDWAVFDVAGLDPESRVGSAVEFFVYDTTKIVLLLVGSFSW